MAMNFGITASANYVSITDNADFYTMPMSICCWFRLTDTPAGNFQLALCKRGSFANYYTWAFQAGFSTNIYMTGNAWDNSGTNYSAGHGNLVINTWYHMVLTISTSNLCLYFDGDEYTEIDPGLPTLNNGTGAGGLTFGTDAGTADQFNGQLDDIRIYSRALSLNEAITMYNSRGHDTIIDSLVGRWMMNEGSLGQAVSGANSVRDYSSNLRHGSPNNTLTYYESVINYHRRSLTLQ
jgi:hypothetical protein